jgi:hypothetical protein
MVKFKPNTEDEIAYVELRNERRGSTGFDAAGLGVSLVAGLLAVDTTERPLNLTGPRM